MRFLVRRGDKISEETAKFTRARIPALLVPLFYHGHERQAPLVSDTSDRAILAGGARGALRHQLGVSAGEFLNVIFTTLDAKIQHQQRKIVGNVLELLPFLQR